MERLKKNYKGFALYQAGLPNFPRIFFRDAIVAAILAGDHNMLKNQLSFCISKQGQNKNHYSGKELGKIFHEYPGIEIEGLSTEYNACDTTALYLIGHEVYQELTGDKSLAQEHKKNIKKATKYILSHLKDDLFMESPGFCGAERFALKVTYWKDSELKNGVLGNENRELNYPVVYTLAHIQNMCGLRSAAKILNSKKLEKAAEKMKKGLQKLYDKEQGAFYIAVDKQGPIRGISSDLLHALFYLNPGDLPEEQLEKILELSGILETPIGYRTYESQLANQGGEECYTRIVWPFEQAMIHIGAKKFGLDRVSKVSSRVMQHLDTDPEILVLEDEGIKKDGCDPQLWTIAAKIYFERNS